MPFIKGSLEGNAICALDEGLQIKYRVFSKVNTYLETKNQCC
jgi:hypothetical protein